MLSLDVIKMEAEKRRRRREVLISKCLASGGLHLIPKVVIKAV